MLVSPSDPEGSSGTFGLERRDLAGVGYRPISLLRIDLKKLSSADNIEANAIRH